MLLEEIKEQYKGCKIIAETDMESVDFYALSKQNKDFLEARFIKNEEALARYKSIIKKCIVKPVELYDF